MWMGHRESKSFASDGNTSRRPGTSPKPDDVLPKVSVEARRRLSGEHSIPILKIRLPREFPFRNVKPDDTDERTDCQCYTGCDQC